MEGGDSARFRVRIARSADSDWERELMERAESLYPHPALIADSVDAHLAPSSNHHHWSSTGPGGSCEWKETASPATW